MHHDIYLIHMFILFYSFTVFWGVLFCLLFTVQKNERTYFGDQKGTDDSVSVIKNFPNYPCDIVISPITSDK